MLGISTSWWRNKVDRVDSILEDVLELGLDGVELEYRITSKMYQEMKPRSTNSLPVFSIHNFFPLPEEFGLSQASGDLFLLSSTDSGERQRAVKYTIQTMQHAHDLEARAVVLRRDARATCFSNLTHALSGAANDFGADMVDTAEMFRFHLDLVGRWRRLFPNRVTLVPYERLTEDPEAESRKLVAAAGLAWDPACLAFHESRRAVRTASADQVRRPIYRGSSEVWRRYEAFLGPMLARLDGL